jgi:tripartite-type tricarboxylate transporter receptor subunit TctC
MLHACNSGSFSRHAAAGSTRIPELPDVAPVSDTYPGFSAASVLFAVAPPNTPPAIAVRLSQAIAEVVRQPDVKKRLEDISLIAVGSTPEQARETIEREAVLWRKAIGATIARVQSQ